MAVKINWNNFLSSAYIDGTMKEEYFSAIQYAIRQWNNYPGRTPWYYFAGETPETDSSPGEVLLKMADCIGELATTSPYGSDCSFIGQGQFNRANIRFRLGDPDIGCASATWSVGDLDDLNTTNFVAVLIHELGHTQGLNHSCECSKCGLPANCDDAYGNPTFMGMQIMNPGYPGQDEPWIYKNAHGPWSWDANNVRMLRGQYSHEISHFVTSNAGSSWSLQGTSVASQTTNNPVGVAGSNANGRYVVAWQGLNGYNNLNTIVGDGVNWWTNTKVTLSQNSQLGVSLAGDGGGTNQRMVMAFNYGDTIGSSGAMDRWVDLAYSTNQGSSWTYQATSMRSVARPGIAYSPYYDKWVVAYASRDDRRIIVHVMSDSFPLTVTSGIALQNGGYNVGAYGDVQVACRHNENKCVIVFSSDGSGDVSSQDAFKVRSAFGHIVSATNTFVVDSYEWVQSYPGIGAAVVNNSKYQWVKFHNAWADWSTTGNHAYASKYYSYWMTRYMMDSSVDISGTMAFSDYWNSTYGEASFYVLRY